VPSFSMDADEFPARRSALDIGPKANLPETGSNIKFSGQICLLIIWLCLIRMDKRVMKTAQSDRLILVDAKKLLEHADPADLKCRDSDVIEDLYHPDWFFEYKGAEHFTPPAVYIENGVIKFINGRHRTLLLSRYLEAFPLLIGNLDLDCCGETATAKSIEVLNEITVDQLAEHSVFKNLPELKFGDFPQA
jgi:hypothetical protein